MAEWRKRLFPTLPAEEYERRLNLFRVLLRMQIVATIPLAVISIVDSGQFWIVGLCLGMILVAAWGKWLAQRGWFHTGASFLVLSQLAFVTFFVAFYGTRGPIPIFFVWPIMVSAVLLEPATAFFTAALAAVLYGGLAVLELSQIWILPLFEPEFFSFWHQPDSPRTTQRFLTDSVDVIVAYFGTAVLSWFASRSLQQALKHSRGQRRELENYRAELEKSMAELHQTTAELQSSLQVIHQVGSPVLPILEGALLVPLIGDLDTERMRLIVERVLHETARKRARIVIMDITGVSVVDSAVANALIQASQGIRLLGATPILAGIQSTVAKKMVSLDVDLSGIIIRAGLQEGLAYALESAAGQDGPGHRSQRTGKRQ